MSARLRDDRGGGLVEFALVSAFVLTTLFGIIDFGRAMYAYDLVASAARLGSRYAMVRGSACTAAGCPATTASIASYVLGASPGVDPAKLVILATWSITPACPVVPGRGCIVTVKATYPYTFVAFPYTALMTSTSQMAIAQ